MDAHHFDRWLRLLTAAPSRRGALSLFGAIGLATLLSDDAAAANRKRRLRRRKRRRNKRRSCAPSCSGKMCGDDGCGGSCGGCAAPSETCAAGTCVCASGFKPCQSNCIALLSCCTAAECGTVSCTGGSCDCTGQPDGTDCGNGAQCVGGVCTRPPACAGLNGVCTVNEECCSDGCQAIGGCACSQPGEPCHVSSDCCQFPALQSCVSFACVAA
jgi:hypothetical protein